MAAGQAFGVVWWGQPQILSVEFSTLLDMRRVVLSMTMADRIALGFTLAITEKIVKCITFRHYTLLYIWFDISIG